MLLSPRWSCSLVGLVGVLLFSDAPAEQVRVPLAMDGRFIETLVREQVFTGPSGSVRLNDDGSGCQFLELRNPRIVTGDGLVRLRTDAEARAGRSVGDRCLLILNWQGQLEFDQRPAVSGDRKSVLLRTESWRVLSPDGQPATVSTTIGHWLEQFLPIDLKETRISLAQPLGQLEEFLTLILAPDATERVNRLVESLAIDDVSAHDDVLTVTLGLDVLPAPAPPQAPEPELTEAELARLQTRLEEMDAFVTYTIKYLSTGSVEADTADELLEVLLEARYELIAIAAETRRAPQDPVRKLFVDTWDRLTPVLHEIAGQQADHESAVRYLTFIGAGDMLRALDRVGPAAGVEISADGLRRLARTLVPLDTEDPLQRDDAVDPQLREAFGFGAALPPPQEGNEISWLERIVQPAAAADELDPSMIKKLNNWVPKLEDIDAYLPMVRDVLRYAVAEQLRAKELDRAFHDVFRNLVLTAAWQESCWRQFVVEKTKRVPLQSRTGDVGLMQINSRVWRGFYDQHGLKWDIVYNARAGAEILEHYMIKYAIRHREHKTTGKVESLARSAYAAYNGGPRQYDRYRRKSASAHGKQVDTLFIDKYRAVRSGKELAVKACYRE